MTRSVRWACRQGRAALSGLPAWLQTVWPPQQGRYWALQVACRSIKIDSPGRIVQAAAAERQGRNRSHHCPPKYAASLLHAVFSFSSVLQYTKRTRVRGAAARSA